MSKQSPILIELQHFHGCPNSDKMIDNVKAAITESDSDIEYKEVLVDTPEKAEIYKFRGSPTLLINGMDLEGMTAPESGNLACRYYKKGIPSVEEMIDAIERFSSKNKTE